MAERVRYGLSVTACGKVDRRLIVCLDGRTGRTCFLKLSSALS